MTTRPGPGSPHCAGSARQARPRPIATRFAAALVIPMLAMAMMVGERTTRTGATFTGVRSNLSNSFGAVTLATPTNLAGSGQGGNVVLTWSAGDAVATGYRVLGAPVSAGSCSTFAVLGTAATTIYTDAGRASGSATAYCYEVVATDYNWSSAATAPVQVTFTSSTFQVASVVVNNGAPGACGTGSTSTAGTLDCGDTITVTFSHPADVSTGPLTGDTICVNGPHGSVYLESSGSGQCAATDAVHLGTLQVPTSGFCFFGYCLANARYASTFAWSSGNKVLVVTVGAQQSASIGGATTSLVSAFAPAPTIKSNNGTPICTTAACEPAPTGGF